jgi:hypothetical protein
VSLRKCKMIFLQVLNAVKLIRHLNESQVQRGGTLGLSRVNYIVF